MARVLRGRGRIKKFMGSVSIADLNRLADFNNEEYHGINPPRDLDQPRFAETVPDDNVDEDDPQDDSKPDARAFIETFTEVSRTTSTVNVSGVDISRIESVRFLGNNGSLLRLIFRNS